MTSLVRVSRLMESATFRTEVVDLAKEAIRLAAKLIEAKSTLVLRNKKRELIRLLGIALKTTDNKKLTELKKHVKYHKSVLDQLEGRRSASKHK